MDGKNRNPVDKLVAGDIGATLKLKDTYTNQTLHAKGLMLPSIQSYFQNHAFVLPSLLKQKPMMRKSVKCSQRYIRKIPPLTLNFPKNLRQLILSAQGEMHLTVCKWNLENTFKLNVEFVTPRISYRETIRKPALANYRHKKQSGGAGQFGEVYLKIEPYYEGMPEPTEYSVRGKEVIDLEWGGKLVFYNCIVGGVIDARFIPSILKGVMEKMEEGPHHRILCARCASDGL